MRKSVVSAGGSIVAAMLAAFMGCAGDPTNQRAASSPSPRALPGPISMRWRQPSRLNSVKPFQPPPELISQNGLLETTFNVQPTTFNVAGAEVRGYAYQGQFIGPTLRVQPGDTVRVQLRNGLKEPTNLHSHGMFVSPIGISDNVLRVMKAGSTNEFVLDLPDDVERERTGTTPTCTGASKNRCSPGCLECSSSRDCKIACRRSYRTSPNESWPSRTFRSRMAPSSGATSTPTLRPPVP